MEQETTAETFARNLKRIRKKMGLSQEKFAELCDVDRTYISALERKLRYPSFKAIAKLNIRPKDFFED